MVQNWTAQIKHLHEMMQTLVYNGQIIHDRGEMLSLTDMWRAAGSDPQMKPAKWKDLPSAQTFIEHVGEIVGKSDLFRSSKGRLGETWAHWILKTTKAPGRSRGRKG